MTTEYTTNRGYPKPDFDTRTWHDQMHTSLDMIDSDIQAVALISGTTPTLWVNNHPYVIGNTVVDISNQTIYLCQVNHTSAAAGTFAADRVAHPTFWLSQGVPFTNISYQWTAIQEFLGGWTTGATGGNKGNNTWNAGTFYENGVSLASKYVLKAGDTMAGNLTLSPPSGVAAITVNAIAAAQNASVVFQQTNVAKWQIGKDTSDAFFLYDNVAAASVITAPSNGTSVSFSRGILLPIDPSVPLGAATKQYVDAVKTYVDSRVGGGFRNILRRNGGFEVWQRGAGGSAVIAVPTATPAGTYTADGWYLSTNANQACTVSQVAGITNGSQWAAKVQRNAGQTGVNALTFGFPLDTDEIFPLLGQYVLVSFTAKMGANYSGGGTNLTCALAYGTGAPTKYSVGFVGSTLPVVGTATLSTTPTRYSYVTAAPIPLNARQMEVFFACTPVGTAGADDSFTIDDVQLEIVPAAAGYVANPFERLSFTEQLLLCRRHYLKTFSYGTAPAQNVGTNTGELRVQYANDAGSRVTYFPWRFPTSMRITPAAVTTYNPAAANAEARNITDGLDCASTSGLINLTAEGTIVSTTSNTGAGFGDVMGVHAVAEAGI